MDVVKAQLERIRQQLAGLTATQRMLAGTLVAVMVLTMLYWGKYASSPDMVAVFDQSLNDDEIGRIDMMLESRGVPHSVSGGKVLVPADRKMELLADLMYQQMLPRDSRSAFDEMVKAANPLAPRSEADMNYNLALQKTLAQVIRHFPGVADAQVIINAKSERHVENSIVPTATVFITMRDGSLTPPKQLIVSAADGVAGTVSGLTRGHVSVIVNGRSNRVPDADAANSFAGADDIMEAKARSEQRLEEKIRSQFSYIQGLTATVTCDVENRTQVEQKMVYDPDKTVVKPSEIQTSNQETTNTAPTAAEPGVGANTAGSIVAGAGGGGESQNSSTTDEKTKNQIFASSTQTNTQTPAGKDTAQSATVRVPRSYFSGIYKAQNPNAKDPDDAALASIRTTELASIRDGVKKCVGLKSDDDLSVDMYVDTIPGGVGGTLVMATGSSPVSSSTGALGSVTAYGKEIALGVLAVVSLFMMSSMVRKSAPAPLVAASPKANEPPPILVAGEGLAGEASTGDAMLSGMELDDDAVQTQQMLEQVSTMVKENPDGAAALVKRWLNRS
jgi:flagellar biosynthesis/type III secretory pathway M-ring protein FliF/YscJ